MFNQKLINELRKSRVHLLDIPNYRNIGDYLIFFGELNYFKKNRIKLNSISSKDNFDSSLIQKGDIILLHGGGNFGDLYIDHTNFRNKIVKKFSQNKILILPQTIYFKDKEKLKKTSNIFSTHNNLTIFARDKVSLDIFKTNFKKNTILLHKDFAYDLNLKKNKDSTKIQNILFLKRTDEESKFTLFALKFNIVYSDWFNLKRFNYWNLIHIIFRIFRNFLSKKQYTRILMKYSKLIVKYNVEKIRKYDLIITDRLHGLILADLLNIKVIAVDNSYSKIKNYYDSWLKNKKNCYFVNNNDELNAIIKKLI